MTQACHRHDWCLCLLLLILNVKVKTLPMQEVAIAEARVLKPHVNCMSAMESVSNKAHASMHLPQHAVQVWHEVKHNRLTVWCNMGDAATHTHPQQTALTKRVVALCHCLNAAGVSILQLAQMVDASCS